jgi:hypothetical protein
MSHAIFVLNNSKPKEVKQNRVIPPICVFTDGAFEAQEDGSYLAAHGTVMFDPTCDFKVCHDGLVPPCLVDLWRTLIGEQLIGQIEIYPVVALRIKYAHLFANRRVLYFIDNDSARDALIRGSSKSIPSFALLSLFYEQEEIHPSFPWFCRVPSSSNPADAPSRGEVQKVVDLFGLKYEGPLIMPDSAVDRLMATTSIVDLL